jgi:hypothetical protein
MPSDPKKITLLARGQFDFASAGAANAPTGEINMEKINRTENKRSRGIRWDALLRATMTDLSIIILSSDKLEKRLNCKHGPMRSRSSSLDQICFAHHTAFPMKNKEVV